MKKGLLYWFVLAMLAAPSAHACTLNGYIVANGATIDVDECGVCQRITNGHASGLQIFVPTKTAAEWTTFRTTPPPGVVFAACVFGACGDTACTGGETCVSCPADCGGCAGACGDATCQLTETNATCPADCPP